MKQPTKQGLLGKYTSIVYRMGQAHHDAFLSPYGIGCGQQFFLLVVRDHPGVSQLELAQAGNYDPGTTARAVRKLEEKGYLRRTADASDRRVNQLYVTDAALPVIEATMRMLEDWYLILTQGFSEEEKLAAESLLERLAENAYRSIRDSRKE